MQKVCLLINESELMNLTLFKNLNLVFNLKMKGHIKKF